MTNSAIRGINLPQNVKFFNKRSESIGTHVWDAEVVSFGRRENCWPPEERNVWSGPCRVRAIWWKLRTLVTQIVCGEVKREWFFELGKTALFEKVKKPDNGIGKKTNLICRILADTEHEKCRKIHLVLIKRNDIITLFSHFGFFICRQKIYRIGWI